MNKGCCTCIWRTVFSVLGVPAIRPRRKFTPSSRHRVEFLKLTLPLSRDDGPIATQRTGGRNPLFQFKEPRCTAMVAQTGCCRKMILPVRRYRHASERWHLISSSASLAR